MLKFLKVTLMTLLFSGSIYFLLTANPVFAVIDTSSIRPGKVAVAESHFCYITDKGGVKCSGYNDDYGSAGTGSLDNVAEPTDVVGLTSGVKTVSTSGYHTCVLTDAGGVKCWGYNGNGQLGVGSSYEAERTPIDVTGLLSGVTSVVAGYYNTCALMDNGAVKCWGYNNMGALGTDDVPGEDILTPSNVVGLPSDITQITTTDGFQCALQSNGNIWCWGLNNHGQLGRGTFTAVETTPELVIGVSNAVQVSATTNSACALIDDGSVKCWGRNNLGQLGITPGSSEATPIEISGLTGVTYLAGSGLHVCAIMTGSEVVCWGYNSDGQGGIGNTNESILPTSLIDNDDQVTSIAGGYYSTCLITIKGELKCVGAEDLYGGNNFGTEVITTVVGECQAYTTGFRVCQKPAGLNTYLSSDWSTDVSMTNQLGTKAIGISTGANKVALVNISFAENLDWSNLMADSISGKVHFDYSGGNIIDIPGLSTNTYTLLIPKTSNANGVQFCPNSNNVSEVTINCNGGVFIKQNTSGIVGTDAITVTTGSDVYVNYWLAIGLSKKMGAVEKYFADTTNPVAPPNSGPQIPTKLPIISQSPDDDSVTADPELPQDGDANKFLVIITDGNGNPIVNTKVIIDGVEYRTNEKGEIILDKNPSQEILIVVIDGISKSVRLNGNSIVFDLSVSPEDNDENDQDVAQGQSSFPIWAIVAVTVVIMGVGFLVRKYRQV